MANHSHIPGIPPAKELLDDVMENQVRMILVSHRDRFVRFGFDWFERFCKKFNVEIVVVKNEKLSPQEELVQDIVSILQYTSCIFLSALWVA